MELRRGASVPPAWSDDKEFSGIRIVVVGAGASGTALLYELLQHVGTNGVQVCVVDAEEHRGSGVVFGDDLSCALVNRQAKHMSVVHDDSEDFIRWAQIHAVGGSATEPTDYFSRPFYGQYLKERFREVCELWAQSGAPVVFRRATVTSVSETPTEVMVETNRGTLIADFAVLCTGHGIRANSGYNRTSGMASPYPLKGLLELLGPQAEVAILGAGLTAIDCALAILDSSPSTVVTLISRSGVLPDVRAPFGDEIPLSLPARTQSHGATLLELLRRFRTELRTLDVSHEDLRRYVQRLNGGIEALRNGIPHSEAEAYVQSVAISVANRDLPTYWFGFSEDDRAKYLRHYYRLMQVICAPIPPATAVRIRAAIREGRVVSTKGTLERTGPHSWTLSGTSREFECVVDGTGEATNASQVAFESQLANSGACVLAAHGGISVRQNGRVVHHPGDESRLYAVGYATRGSFLFSSSLYQAVRNSRVVAKDIATRVRVVSLAAAECPGSIQEVRV